VTDLSASILVIDDDRDMRRLLRDFLIRGGYGVIEAATGDEAIRLIESAPIDVVILDKEMPGMNGFDVLAYLRRRRPETPVIFITAFGGPEVAEESRRRGARRYVEKPFRVTEVVETVQAVLDESTI
jgi:DNA-binding NtrC family response regulator